jgi:extracellular factor (EF) 3-hydroxypalmitic acid methyl ester biosynthesis protein
MQAPRKSLASRLYPLAIAAKSAIGIPRKTKRWEGMTAVDSYFGNLGDGAGSVADDEALNMLGYWNQLWDRCKSGDIVSSVYETADAMLRVKRKFNDAEKWRLFAQGEQFAGLRLALREDPFSNRAVTRPRGYPGDAVLLDMAYRIVGPTETTSTIGKMAFEATTNSPGSRSVRARKLCVAKFIDSVAVDIYKPRIVSVACGHLRELDCSRAFAAGKVGAFLGVDQDAESIAVVEKNFGSRGVIARCATLKDFLQQRVDAGPFHGIYSVGLFDYLDDATAAKATAAMFRMVAPGGRLLIANLAPSLGDIAYMEAVMDWWMVYRSESQLADIAKKAVGTDSADIRTFADVLGNVAFAEIRRKAA